MEKSLNRLYRCPVPRGCRTPEFCKHYGVHFQLSLCLRGSDEYGVGREDGKEYCKQNFCEEVKDA